jgi:hypothetical protein
MALFDYEIYKTKIVLMGQFISENPSIYEFANIMFRHDPDGINKLLFKWCPYPALAKVFCKRLRSLSYFKENGKNFMFLDIKKH